MPVVQTTADVARWLRIVIAAVVAIALAVACLRLDLHGIGAVLAGASLPLWCAAVALNLGPRTAARARRTQLLLGGRVPFRDVVRLNLAGYAAQALLPGPAAEIVCSTQLARRNGFSLREVLSFQALDKSLGAISVAAVALVLAPPLVAVAVGTAGIALLALGARRLLVPLGWLLVSNVLCLAMIALCIVAVGGQITMLGCVAILVATSLAAAIPFVPGQVGTLETGFALAAVHHGIAPHVALAAGVLYHLAHAAPVTLAGLPLLLRLRWERAACA